MKGFQVEFCSDYRFKEKIEICWASENFPTLPAARLGLRQKPLRTEGGYRFYNTVNQQRLLFMLLNARRLGFSLELYCADALALVNSDLCEVKEKIAELQLIQQALVQMVSDCQCCCPGAQALGCTRVDALSNLEK
ncbi:hypothetical protein G3491_22625 [Shewanella baltica]|uniref:hypothetical protein n=1 Tax=Shewanella baltica TaxID=62322 RepID=UPI00217EB1A7|nr:hypothetical protein [Shewanella baltica]MCS6148124.1 hypothetical protein [Shewanella baltica]MCW1254546.1 hypothetical protein [Shewanella baltica]